MWPGYEARVREEGKTIYRLQNFVHVWILEDYNCIPLQAQLKEAQHDVDEANKARDDLASRLKELEKKIRNYEAELNNAQEVHASMKINLVSFPGTSPPPVFDLQKWTCKGSKTGDWEGLGTWPVL